MENIAKALIKAQTELKNPEKNQQGYGYKYADLASIIDQVKPVLQKHGLVVTQLATTGEGGNVGVSTILLHESGEMIESTLTLPITEMKGVSVTQGAGATITYARRYALSAILNISADDDTDASPKPKQQETTPDTTETKKERATDAQVEGLTRRLKLLKGNDASLEDFLKANNARLGLLTKKQASFFVMKLDAEIEKRNEQAN